MKSGEGQTSGLPDAGVSGVEEAHRLVRNKSEPSPYSQQQYNNTTSSSNSSSKARAVAAPPDKAGAAESAVALQKRISTAVVTGGSVGAAEMGETYLDGLEGYKTGLFLQQNDPVSYVRECFVQ